jgi:hypothetical protein
MVGFGWNPASAGFSFEGMMSIYNPLRDHLMGAGDVVIMNFDELDNLVLLPQSARKYKAWWTNEDVETTAHVQCKAWQAAGYEAEPHLKAQRVVFRRKTT